MALLLFTGTAGTGKTLFAVQRYIIPELAKGTKIYTNIDNIILWRLAIIFDLDICKLENNFNQLQHPDRFWEETPKNSYIVLDEAQNIFNNRQWQSKDNQDCVKYLMEHRHYGHHVIMITPHIESLDAGIRRVAAFTYKHRSMSAFGSETIVRCAIFLNDNIYQPPLQVFSWKHDRRIYDCYSSYFEQGTTEKKPKVNIWANSRLIVFGLIFLVCMVFVLKSLPKFLNKFQKNNTKKTEVILKNQAEDEFLDNYQEKRSGRGVIRIGDSILTGQRDYVRGIR